MIPTWRQELVCRGVGHRSRSARFSKVHVWNCRTNIKVRGGAVQGGRSQHFGTNNGKNSERLRASLNTSFMEVQRGKFVVQRPYRHRVRCTTSAPWPSPVKTTSWMSTLCVQTIFTKLWEIECVTSPVSREDVFKMWVCVELNTLLT